MVSRGCGKLCLALLFVISIIEYNISYTQLKHTNDPGERKKLIESFYEAPYPELLVSWYERDRLSTIEIAEKLFNELTISLSFRSIQKRLTNLGATMRTKHESYLLAIQKGRRDYNAMRKPIKAAEFRKGINLRLRYEVLKRDGFRCVLCGNSAQDGKLEIDHIIPVVSGGSNSLQNLRVLCIFCNRGKRFAEHER